jgi:hypothetical protein
MEYVITTRQSFAAIEALAIETLEQQGFEVQRTFSLHSAAKVGRGSLEFDPGYSVLMVYALGVQRRPMGLVTLYERGEQMVIRPMLELHASKQSSQEPGASDANAGVIAALALGGLGFGADTEGIEPVDLSLEENQ